MEDVARALGVHRTTVSLALRRDPRIPQKTQETVAAAAARLGYRPNPLVSALMQLQRGRRKLNGVTTLAYLTYDSPKEAWRRNPAYVEIFESAFARAASLGYRMEEFSLTKDGMNPRRAQQILIARGIRGVLLAPPPGSDSRVEINLKDFAAIGLGLRIREPFIERVSTDHYQAMRLALRACREKGYRRPGLVVGETASERIGHRWEAAFLLENWMAAGESHIPILTGPINDGAHVTPPKFSAWLRRHRPDVVITTPSDRAREWIAAIKSNSSGIGFASLGLRDRSGQIAGVWQNHTRLGAIAVELLAAKLQRNEHGAEHATDTHLVEGEWVDGLSLPEFKGRRRSAQTG
jgi:DNA-binding LacI/PurR family transcriptional regulator